MSAVEFSIAENGTVTAKVVAGEGEALDSMQVAVEIVRDMVGQWNGWRPTGNPETMDEESGGSAIGSRP